MAEALKIPSWAVRYLLEKARSITDSTLFVKTKDGMIPDNAEKEFSVINNSVL